MSLDTEVYDERVEKNLPSKAVPPRIATGEALSTILPENKILATNWSTQKLCFLPGVPLVQELPKLLSRRDDPYEDEEGAAVACAHILQYENLMAVLNSMDREFFLLMKAGAF